MKKLILLMILLMIPLVSAEPFPGGWYWYYLGEDDYDLFEVEYYSDELTAYGDWDNWTSMNNSLDWKCQRILNNIDEKLLKKVRKIRVWDNHPKQGQPAGLYFLSNIIHIYDGCRNPDTLIHELAHLDRQSIKHDSFYWLSYYRIKMESYDEI